MGSKLKYDIQLLTKYWYCDCLLNSQREYLIVAQHCWITFSLMYWKSIHQEFSKQHIRSPNDVHLQKRRNTTYQILHQ